MECPICGKDIFEKNEFCWGCGSKVPRCPTCGKVLYEPVERCPVDGTKIPDEMIAALASRAPRQARPAEGSTPRPAPQPTWQMPQRPAQAPAPQNNSQAQQQPAQQPAPQPAPQNNGQAQQPAPQPDWQQSAPQNNWQQSAPQGNWQQSAPQNNWQPPQQPAWQQNQPMYRAPQKKSSGTNKALVAVLVILCVVMAALLVLLGSKLFDKKKDEQAAVATDGVQLDHETQVTTQPTERINYMPDCDDLDEDQVERLFSDMGYSVRYHYEYSDTVPKGYVISQSVYADTQIDENSEITIVISKGQDTAPEGYNQKVVVKAAPGSSYGTLWLYEWRNSQWVECFSCDATVGYNGISANYGEGTKRTPMGTFKLGVAFSANSISNSDWPFQRVYSSSCIVDDIYSPYYNTFRNINNIPSGTHYDPIGNTLTQGYSNILIYIEHNGNGLDSTNVVAGRGSVITVCGRYPSLAPTAGCVDISANNMLTLISMLDYSKDPHIEISCN